MPEQRYPYRGPRPWLRLGFMAADGSVLYLDLVADTGSPASLILREDLFDRLVPEPTRDRAGNFGLLRGGWLRLYNPELGLVEFVEGYGNDDAPRRVARSHPDFAGLVGLPVLRLGEYGGNATDFWFRTQAPADPS